MSRELPAHRRLRLWWAAVVALLCLTAVPLCPCPAYAADAKTLYAEAQRLYKYGKVEPALAKFRQAYELSSSPNAQLGIGRCLKDLGRNAEAYEQLQAAQREATERSASDESYIQTRDAAASLIAILDPKVGKLVIALTGASGEAVTVRIGDQRVEPEKIGVPIPLEPQKAIVVSATAPDKLPAEHTVEIRAGRTITVSLELKGNGPQQPADNASTSAASKSVSDGKPSALGPLRIAGIVVAAVLGAGGAVTFGVTGSIASKRESELQDAGCPSCNVSYQDKLDNGKTMQTVANVGLGIGIAGLVGGTLMIIFGGPSAEPDASPAKGGSAPDKTEPAPDKSDGAGPAVSVSPQGGTVGYTWRF